MTTGPRAGSAGRAAAALALTLRARPRKLVESVAAILKVWEEVWKVVEKAKEKKDWSDL